jgi:hypothetical protein
MQQLLYALCRQPAVPDDAWAEWQLDAVLASFLVVWRHTRTPGLAPSHLQHCLKQREGSAAAADADGRQPPDQQQRRGLGQAGIQPSPAAMQGEAQVGPFGGLTEVQFMTAELVPQQVSLCCLRRCCCFSGVHYTAQPSGQHRQYACTTLHFGVGYS